MEEGYWWVDPTSIPQLVVPITVQQHCSKAALLSNDALVHTIGWVDIIAFFYILYVGEYTKPQYVISEGKHVRSPWTQHFSVGDVWVSRMDTDSPDQ